MIKTEKALTQWDLDRVVEISTNEKYNQVHFYNRNSENALVVEPNEDDTANIPNILLQEAESLVAWLVYKTDEGKRSIEVETLHVKPRKKPDDYVYTETEVMSFEKLVKDVEEAVEYASAVAKDLEEKRDSGYFKGDKGEPGVNGTNGKTPVKGVDYYTEEEKDDLIAEITESVTGDIDVALDNIIAIQNELIGGGSV